MPKVMGMDLSAIGIQASSDMTSVITSSNGSISPICRLPISRMASSNTANKIIARMKIIIIRLVCGTCRELSTQFAPFCHTFVAKTRQRMSVFVTQPVLHMQCTKPKTCLQIASVTPFWAHLSKSNHRPATQNECRNTFFLPLLQCKLRLGFTIQHKILHTKAKSF